MSHVSPVHHPVLLQETLEYLNPQPGDQVVDGTLGLGGHALEILKRIAPPRSKVKGHYYGFDLDLDNLAIAQQRLSDFSSSFSQATFFHSNFAHCHHRLQSVGVDHVERILLDLGLSSPHVDQPERGFSYLTEGPLDMRFDRSSDRSQTAADVLNHTSESELRRILYEYGEERYAPKIASMVVKRRKLQPFVTTTHVMELLGELMKSPGDRRRMASRVFQALRIAVNDELQTLEQSLPLLLAQLSPGGRMVVITFHSLEDRIVKRAFKAAAMAGQTVATDDFHLLTKKPIEPSPEELISNPRSRSAKLRAIEREK